MKTLPSRDSLKRILHGLGAVLLATLLGACALLGTGRDTLPPPDVELPSSPPTATPPPASVSEATTAAQLEQFEFVWEQINRLYAYEDYNGVDWNAVRRIYRKQVEDGLDDEMYQAAMRAMVSELRDENTFYLSPEDLAEREAQQEAQDDPDVGYIGTLVGTPDGVREDLTILYVYPDSPAEEAGLLAHDVIVGIAGQPVPEGASEEVLSLIRGEVGTDVALSVRSPDAELRDVDVSRAPLGPSSMIEANLLEGNVGYIFIPPGTEEASIGVRTTQALRALREQGAESLILDLRISRVGTNWPVNELLGLFVHGEVYELFNATESQTVIVGGKNVAGSQDLPLAVLVGHDTVGLSEILAGSLQSLGRATVVGGPTGGHVEVIFNVGVGEDALLVISAASARGLENGPVWGREGVQPDVEMDLRWEEFSVEDDPQLERAIEVLRDS